MVPYGLVEDRATLGQPLESPDLISTHEPRIALDVGRKNCDQPPADIVRA
jgi:hypothetical protein